MYNIDTYQDKKEKKDKEALAKLSQGPPETTLLKQLLHEALSDKESITRMTPEQKQSIKDYVNERLQTFEADPNKTLYLYVKHIERLLDHYTLERVDIQQKKKTSVSLSIDPQPIVNIKKPLAAERRSMQEPIQQDRSRALRNFNHTSKEFYQSDYDLVNLQSTQQIPLLTGSVFSPHQQSVSLSNNQNPFSTGFALPQLVNQSARLTDKLKDTFPRSNNPVFTSQMSTQVSKDLPSGSHIKAFNNDLSNLEGSAEIPDFLDVSLMNNEVRRSIMKQERGHQFDMSEQSVQETLGDIPTDMRIERHEISESPDQIIMTLSTPFDIQYIEIVSYKQEFLFYTPKNPFKPSESIIKQAKDFKRTSKLPSVALSPIEHSPGSRMRKTHLKQIINSCQKNMNRASDRMMNTQIEFFKEKVQEETEEQVKIIELYAENVKQASRPRFQSIEAIKDVETINSQNDYENFLTPEAVYEAKMNNKIKILQLTRHNKKVIWKPLKLRLGKVVNEEIEKLMSVTAQ